MIAFSAAQPRQPDRHLAENDASNHTCLATARFGELNSRLTVEDLVTRSQPLKRRRMMRTPRANGDRRVSQSCYCRLASSPKLRRFSKCLTTKWLIDLRRACTVQSSELHASRQCP
jgi:hypothetical protein